MKIAVINLKKIILYILIFFIIFILIFIIRNIDKALKTKNKIKSNIIFSDLIKFELPITNSFNNKDEDFKEINIETKILSMQISILENVIKKEENKNKEVNLIDEEEIKINDEDIKQEESIQENEIKQVIEDKSNTESIITNVISEHNILPAFTDEYQGVKINNQTSFDISQVIQNSKYILDSNKVIIYHTHTCESYTPSKEYNYKMTDTYRTTDLNYNVVRVGRELESELKKYNFNVIHNNTYHDYPSYNGSYGRSLETLQNIYKNNIDAKIIIDLHRDAVGSMPDYAPRVEIDGEICAQIMFVIGTDGSGLKHPKWRENLQFAIEVQKKANEVYPGLFRPIILRNSRFNQQLTTASSIIEVGATGNTLDECILSMKYLAKVFEKLEITK